MPRKPPLCALPARLSARSHFMDGVGECWGLCARRPASQRFAFYLPLTLPFAPLGNADAYDAARRLSRPAPKARSPREHCSLQHFPSGLEVSRAHTHTCTRTRAHTCMHAHIYANPQHTCVHTCSHTRTCIHARAHTHSHTCTHAHAHTCAHTHRGTHAHAWQRSRDREGRGHFVGIFKRRQWPFLTMSPVPHFRALSSVTV